MRLVDGTLMRIFLDENDRYSGRPLYMAVVDELQRAGFPGATVFKGIEGYGSRHHLNAARSYDIPNNLPVLIEVVGTQETISNFVPHLRALISDGLITLERIHILRGQSGER
jgi:PII-like signaling protein